MTRADVEALAHRASMKGNHALAGLLHSFADRAGDPRTEYLIRTVIDGEGL